jgi:hypothetical protein
MPATFGELTELAHAHLDVAARHALRATSAEQQAAFAAALDACMRATSSLVAAPPPRARVRPDPAVEQAAQTLRDSLKYARQLLRTALPRVLDEELTEQPAATHPAAAHLVTAAVTIGASRDLLETHTIWTATGRQDRSDLAAHIDTPDARRELTVTAAGHTDRIAALTGALAVTMREETPGPKPGLVLDAAESLAAAANAAAGRTPQRRLADFLHDVPALGPLRREPVQPGEPFLTLLDKAVAGAKRLHIAAFREASVGQAERHTPSALAAVSVAMAMSHLATHRILDGIITNRQDPHQDTTASDLGEAAAAAKTAFESWSRARERWMGVRAAWGPQDGHVLRAEATDLATRLGRLTYADPTWTPRPGASHTLRHLAHLDFDGRHSTALLDGLQRLAAISASIATEHARLIDVQTGRGQLLVPTRTIPWQLDTHRAWMTAPPHATFALRRAYEEAGAAAVASHRALAQLRELNEQAYVTARQPRGQASGHSSHPLRTFEAAHGPMARDGMPTIDL